jgi:hypothetical protein
VQVVALGAVGGRLVLLLVVEVGGGLREVLILIFFSCRKLNSALPSARSMLEKSTRSPDVLSTCISKEREVPPSTSRSKRRISTAPIVWNGMSVVGLLMKRNARSNANRKPLSAQVKALALPSGLCKGRPVSPVNSLATTSCVGPESLRCSRPSNLSASCASERVSESTSLSSAGNCISRKG